MTDNTDQDTAAIRAWLDRHVNAELADRLDEPEHLHVSYPLASQAGAAALTAALRKEFGPAGRIGVSEGFAPDRYLVAIDDLRFPVAVEATDQDPAGTAAAIFAVYAEAVHKAAAEVLMFGADPGAPEPRGILVDANVKLRAQARGPRVHIDEFGVPPAPVMNRRERRRRLIR